MRYFLTGASGWIGSAVVPELLGAGHEVIGLARSDASAEALRALGVTVERGSLDDLDVLAAAAQSDGVIHFAFKHDEAFSGNFQGAADADRRAVLAMGTALAGSDRPLLLASGLLGLTPGRVATEVDGRGPDEGSHVAGGVATRLETSKVVLAMDESGVRSLVVRFAPSVHGEGDHGFMAMLVAFARARGVAGFLGEGTQRWPAVHRRDAARLCRLALEQAPAGTVVHAVADEGVEIRAIATVIGRRLDIPVAVVAREDAAVHFGPLAALVDIDSPASSVRTRELLGWLPREVGLLDDLERGHYFGDAVSADR